MTASASVSRQNTNQILLVKLTPGARSESLALASGTGGRRHDLQAHSNARIAGRRDVLVVKDSNKLVIGSVRHDPQTAAGRGALLRAIGLTGQQARSVAAVLSKAPPDIRDELAQIARVLKWSNDGKIDLGRIVLSGHFDPVGIRGNQQGDPLPHNGTLQLSTLRELVAAFPVAASRVRHLMVAACWSSGNNADATLARYKEVFPELRSITGYRDKAPRSGFGAERDLKRWSRATRSETTPQRDQVFGRCNPERARISSLARNRCGGAVYR